MEVPEGQSKPGLKEEFRRHISWMLPCALGFGLFSGVTRMVVSGVKILWTDGAADTTGELTPETLVFRAKILLAVAPVLGLLSAWLVRIGLRRLPAAYRKRRPSSMPPGTIERDRSTGRTRHTLPEKKE